MTQMYSATHKGWDHVGNITPNFEYSEAVRPHGELRPADWLPVGRFDKRFEEYFVVSAGKIVAFDRQGHLVPAGLKRKFADETAGGAAVLSYTADDATAGTVNLATGAAVAGAVTYTKSQLSTALINRGLIDDGETADAFISHPVGVAPYNYWQWCGGDGNNPAEFAKHNHSLQHRVAILCKYVIEVPMVPAVQSATNLASTTGISSSAIADWTPSGGHGAWFNSTSLSLTVRYADHVDAGDDVVALNLSVMSLAKDVAATPFAFTGNAATAFSNEVPSISDISAAGDYFVDYDVGVVLVYEENGDAAPAATGTFTFYAYDTVPTSVSTFACAVGDLNPGDFVRTDVNSNYCKHEALDFAATDSVVEALDNGSGTYTGTRAKFADFANAIVDRGLLSMREVIGQVLDQETHPKAYLDRVRTAYPSLTYLDQMPGSASGGLPDKLTYARGSNKVCRILLLK